MAEMNDTTCSSSPSLPEPDDISLFLRQILFRSSSSLSSSSSPMAQTGKQLQTFSSSHLTTPQNQYPPNQSSVHVSASEVIFAASSSSALNSSTSGGLFSSSGGYFPASGANVSSSSVGTIDNETDEYDCESEEGFENLGEEMLIRSANPRNSSKRSRAAEVHNLSEKRRRSRINEKMKALQNLIPNSNKTDKASMLDEAIEYLKQLQLQVQMLTMRNGLSLFPMSLPGVVQPNQLPETRMGIFEGNGPVNMNMRGGISGNQETPTNAVFGLPNQYSNPSHPSVTNLPSTFNSSETSFGLESSIQDHLRAFQLHTSSEEICRGDLLVRQRLNAGHSETNLIASDLKDSALEAHIRGREQPEGLLLTNIESNPVLPPQLNRMHRGRIVINDMDGIKGERLNF